MKDEMNKNDSTKTQTLVDLQRDKTKSVGKFNILEESISKYERLYLWSDIVRSTAESCSAIFSEQVLLAHAEVCDLYVTLMIQHHVV